MLAAGVETEPGEEPLLALTRMSQRQWPAFARAVEEASGLDVGYRDEGTLSVALTRDDAQQLRFSWEFQRGLGLPLEWLSGTEARGREPHLAPNVAAAVHSPGDHQVDNRQLVMALKAAFLAAGGRLHEHREVTGVTTAGGRAVAVQCGEVEHPAETILLAAGPWSRQIAGLPEAARPPVRPVKGQMIALRMDPAAPLLRHVLWAPKAYLVPRGDGRLLIGATVEERGFDTSLTAGGVLALLEGAWRAVPAVEELAIDEMWVGFRPGTRDDAPILGPTAVEGLVLATGHHRNGILLTPVTADLVSRFILTGELDEAIRPFGIDRFRGSPPMRAAMGDVR